MVFIWDYDIETLKKSKRGRILLLERMINYGPGEDKIKLSAVKKHWRELNLTYLGRRLLELLIWGKYRFSLQNKKSF